MAPCPVQELTAGTAALVVAIVASKASKVVIVAKTAMLCFFSFIYSQLLSNDLVLTRFVYIIGIE
jgi:hypothetical protein